MYAPQAMLPPEGTDPRQLVRTMQIICGALMMGVMFFLGIAVFLHFGKGPQRAQATPIVTYMAAGMAALMIIVRLVISLPVTKSAIQQITAIRPLNDIHKLDLYGVYQTQMIVGCALLEGAAFFNLVSFIIDGQLWTLGIVAVLLAMMASSFPTFERVDGWAEDQLRQLQLNPPQ